MTFERKVPRQKLKRKKKPLSRGLIEQKKNQQRKEKKMNKISKLSSELEKNSPIKNKEEFGKNVYFKSEIRQYLQEVVKVILVEETKKFLNEALEVSGLKVQELPKNNHNFVTELSQKESP